MLNFITALTLIFASTLTTPPNAPAPSWACKYWASSPKNCGATCVDDHGQKMANVACFYVEGSGWGCRGETVDGGLISTDGGKEKPAWCGDEPEPGSEPSPFDELIDAPEAWRACIDFDGEEWCCEHEGDDWVTCCVNDTEDGFDGCFSETVAAFDEQGPPWA